MKATWAWSMAVIAGLTAALPLETRAADLSAQSDSFPRMTAVGAQREPQLKEEKTAYGCRGGFGCSPSYGYGSVYGYGCGGAGVAIGIGCGTYGYAGGCNYGACGYGCRPRCRTYTSPCSPCGGYGYSGCGSPCGPSYYGGYNAGYAPIAAPLYGDPTWGGGVSPCGYGAPGYAAPGYGAGGGYGVAPAAPYYGGVNYFSEADSDADTIPVRANFRRNSRRMQGPEMPRQGQFQGPMQGQDMNDSPYYP